MKAISTSARNFSAFRFTRRSLLLISVWFIGSAHFIVAQEPTLDWMTLSGFTGESVDITTDGAGDVIVAKTVNPYSSEDILIIKYTSAGEELWRRTYNTGDREVAYAIVSDTDNNIFVLGSLAEKYLLLKYTSDGALLWNRTFATVGFPRSMPKGMAIDKGTGDVIVIGSSVGMWSVSQMITLRYNAEGTLLWSRTYDRFSHENVPTGITIDPMGNALITGYTTRSLNPSGESPGDQMLIKYDREGNELWSHHFNYGLSLGRSLASADKSTDIGYDELGNIYLVSSTDLEAGTDGLRTIYLHLSLYDSTGTFQWRQELEMMPYGRSYVTGGPYLAVHNATSVYVAYSIDGFTKLSKYNLSGTREWVRRQLHDRRVSIKDIGVDYSENVYLGKSGFGTTHPEIGVEGYYWISCYDPIGSFKWEVHSPFTGTHYYIKKMYVEDDISFYFAGGRQVGSEPPQDYLIRYGFNLSAPPFHSVVPESLSPFDSYNISISNGPGSGWCGSELIIDWECFRPPHCSDPVFRASLATDEKIIWNDTFNEAYQKTLPESEEYCSFLLSQEIDNGVKEIVSIDKNLVKSGIKSLSLMMLPEKKTMQIKAQTEDGKSCQLKIDLVNRDGKSIWKKELLAPMDEELSDLLNEPVAGIQISSIESDQTFSYYPNPFSGEFTVNVGDDAKFPVEIKIFSLVGNLVLADEILVPGNKHMEMPGQKPGLYILMVKSGAIEMKELIELK